MTNLIPQLLRRSEVMARLGISKSTLHRWVNEGRFPRPIKLGPAAARWRVDDVEQWLDEREEMSC